MLDLKHFETVLTETKAALKPIGNAHKSGGISDEDFAEATRHIIRIFQMAAENDLSGAYFLMDKALRKRGVYGVHLWRPVHARI